MEAWLLRQSALLPPNQHPWRRRYFHSLRLCTVCCPRLRLPRRLHDGLQEGPKKAQDALDGSLEVNVQSNSDDVGGVSLEVKKSLNYYFSYEKIMYKWTS